MQCVDGASPGGVGRGNAVCGWCLTHLGLSWGGGGGAGQRVDDVSPTWGVVGGGVEDSVLMVPHPPRVGGGGRGQCTVGASPTWGWGGGRGQCTDGASPTWGWRGGRGQCTVGASPTWGWGGG